MQKYKALLSDSRVPKHWLRIKTFTKNRFVFTGYDFEQQEIAGMGGGTYTLTDSIYTENSDLVLELPIQGPFAPVANVCSHPIVSEHQLVVWAGTGPSLHDR